MPQSRRSQYVNNSIHSSYSAPESLSIVTKPSIKKQPLHIVEDGASRDEESSFAFDLDRASFGDDGGIHAGHLHMAGDDGCKRRRGASSVFFTLTFKVEVYACKTCPVLTFEHESRSHVAHS